MSIPVAWCTTAREDQALASANSASADGSLSRVGGAVQRLRLRDRRHRRVQGTGQPHQRSPFTRYIL
jgi:hypothetical protein